MRSVELCGSRIDYALYILEAGTNNTHDSSKSERETDKELIKEQDKSLSHVYAQNSNKEENDDKVNIKFMKLAMIKY